MTPRRRKGRIYWRGGRAWGDFRDYADAGGRLEPLVPEGQKFATKDADVAQLLATTRLKELEQLRRDRGLHGRRQRATLADFAAHHLVEKKRAGKVTDAWLELAQTFLQRAVDFLGADRELETIRVSDVRAWTTHLSQVKGHGDRTLSTGTVRHHLNALSNLFRRAQEAEVVPPGFNPVAALMEKPAGRRLEARWLEVPDAALFLEAAGTLSPKSSEFRADVVHPLLATFLLTGGRRSEVLGLEVTDISFGRGTVTFRPNRWRRLKTATSERVVPLWPQLREILDAYLSARTTGMVLHNAPASSLLFPSFRTGAEGRLVELRKIFDRVALRGGWHAGDIRSRALRHTYCASRLQTLDAGAPVSLFTVAREMGHGGDSLVRRIYGHLGELRHRANAVEYRVEQHAAVLGARLQALSCNVS
jgi:integrase